METKYKKTRILEGDVRYLRKRGIVHPIQMIHYKKKTTKTKEKREGDSL